MNRVPEGSPLAPGRQRAPGDYMVGTGESANRGARVMERWPQQLRIPQRPYTQLDEKEHTRQTMPSLRPPGSFQIGSWWSQPSATLAGS